MLDGDYIIASRWLFQYLETKQQFALNTKNLRSIALVAELKDDEFSTTRIKNYLNRLLSESYLEWVSQSTGGKKELMLKRRSEQSLKNSGTSNQPADNAAVPGTTGPTLML